MIVAHNLHANNASRVYGMNNYITGKTVEKLSSGYKINRAADGASTLAISEGMRRLIRGLDRAKDNIQDGISYCNVADGALNEVNAMLNRIKELSVQAANGTNSDQDREAIDSEVQEIGQEIDRIFKTTSFNDEYIWPPELEPQASGDPQDFSFYYVQDAAGKYVDGISYMGHKYSWSDLGIGWNQATRSFTEDKTYTIKSGILKDDANTTLDDRGVNAEFTITTKKDTTYIDFQKNYTWSCNDDGILIDNVMADGTTSKEGNTTWTSMGITAHADVAAGSYECNYYGMIISFDVPEEMSWDDFTKAINNPAVTIDWHSKTTGTGSKSQIVNSSTSANKITINNADKDNIANKYVVSANDSTITIKTSPTAGKEDENTGIQTATVSKWSQLDNTGELGDGKYSFSSWGDDVNKNDASKTDSIGKGDSNDGASGITYSQDATYTYATSDSFLKTNGTEGGLDVSLNFKDNQTKEEIINDVNSISYIVDATVSPVLVKPNSPSKVQMTGSKSAQISFYIQRDVLNRAYNGDFEDIVTDGKITIESDMLVANFKGYKMTSDQSFPSIKNAMTSTMDKMYDSMLADYDKEVATERGNKWNDFLTTSLTSDKATEFVGLLEKEYFKEVNGVLTDSGMTILEAMLADNKYSVKASSLYDLSDADLTAMFGASVLTKKDAGGNTVALTDEEKKTEILNRWDALNSSDKLDKLNKLSDDSKAEVICKDLKENEPSRTWIEKASRNYDKANSTAGGNYASLDKLLDFKVDEKATIYEGVRADYLDKQLYKEAGFSRYGIFEVRYEGEKNENYVVLKYNLTDIKYSDLINKESTDDIIARISAIKGDGLADSDTNKEEKSHSAQESLLTKWFTEPNITLSGCGESYQTFSLQQASKKVGNQIKNMPEVKTTKTVLSIQAGPEADQNIDIEYDNMRLSSLGLKGAHVDTEDGALQMLSLVDYAAEKVCSERSLFGAYTNRLESAYNANYNTMENLQAAESKLRDTEMAQEMVAYAKQKILEQVGQAMIAQANNINSGVVALLTQ